MRVLNPEQCEARNYEVMRLRGYHVPFINSLWHMDGHHKLIRWTFVIHAAINSKSDLVTFRNVSDNNHAAKAAGRFPIAMVK